MGGLMDGGEFEPIFIEFLVEDDIFLDELLNGFLFSADKHCDLCFLDCFWNTLPSLHALLHLSSMPKYHQ